MAGVEHTGERARLYAEQAIETLDLSIELSAADMERIVAYGASAFAMGYGAGAEESRRPGWRK